MYSVGIFGIVLVFLDFTECSANAAILKHNVDGCTLPAKPEFGDWEVIAAINKPGDKVPVNTIVKFRCNPGYKLISTTPYVICDEYWSPSNTPQCKQLCPAFYSTTTTTLNCRDVNGIKVDCREVVDGGILSYECEPFYETPYRSPKQLLCQDGVWSSPKPICEPACGRKVLNKLVVPAVAGGNVLNTIEYPWIAAIYESKSDSYHNICGGTIITRKLVLTAAHCTADDYGNALPSENYKIAAGKLYNKFQDARDAKAQYVDVEAIFINPQYRGEARRYVADIALILTKQLFVLGPLVQPVCIKGVTDVNLHAAYDKGEIAGWGLTENGLPSDQLRSLEIPYKSQRTCEQELPSEFAERFKFEDKICAGFYNQNMSVCRGDSGSGLVFKNREDDRYYLHGIVSITPSSGKIGECNLQQNSLYTKVAHYYDWTEKHVVQYEVEDCQLPPLPENGKYEVENNKNKQSGDLVSSKEMLIVTCNSGYTPVKSKTSCESANEHTLKCQADKSCQKPELPPDTQFTCINPKNMLIDCSKIPEGSILHFTCPNNYYSIGPTIRFCKGDSWGASPPQCTPKPSGYLNKTTEEVTTPPPETNYDKKVICTYASWAYYSGITPEDLNPHLCTHIYYAFAGIWDNGSMRVGDDWLDINLGLYKRVTDLKKKNKNLKVLLSVGGESVSNSSLFSLVAAGGAIKIDSFIGSTRYFLQTYSFDGLNIDWDYPNPYDKENYINFLRKIKDSYRDKGWLLTASVRYDPAETGYDAQKMNGILDWVIIKTCDFYGGWHSHTGLHSGLYFTSKQNVWERTHLNVNSAVRHWLDAGLDKNKTVISVTFYGRSVQLKDKDQHDISSPVIGHGIGGGVLLLSEICLKYENWTYVWNDEQQSLYKFKDDQWFSYDNKDAMWSKGVYVKNKGLLGVNIWRVEGDDNTGKCGRKYNWLKHLHGGLGHKVNWNEYD